MKDYYVEGYCAWFIVKARSKRAAHSEGVEEFGRGNVKEIRLATDEESKSYIDQKGEIEESDR